MGNYAEGAHFFWHGPALSVYERACISSFVVHGFSTHVWSYDPVVLPAGAVARDAAEILPRGDLTRYTQQGQPGNIAAFTDFFRYELLSLHDGWWFDTDVLCLKPADAFTGFKQRLVVGYESNDLINGAVLRVHDRAFARELKRRADAVAEAGEGCFQWGAVGPVLITTLSRDSEWAVQPVAPSVFYPIGWREADVVLDPTRRDEATERCQSSFSYHIWNEVIRRAAIPKTLMPPAGSFLHDAFVRVAPELQDVPALPLDTFKALIDRIKPETDPGFVYHFRKLWPSLNHAIKKRF